MGLTFQKPRTFVLLTDWHTLIHRIYRSIHHSGIGEKLELPFCFFCTKKKIRLESPPLSKSNSLSIYHLRNLVVSKYHKMQN